MTTATCPYCAGYVRRIADLELKLQQAEAEREAFRKKLADDERAAKRSAHPFRRADDDLETEKKKPGRPVGHEANLRPLPEEVTETIPVPLPVCPDCGGALNDKQVHVQYQTDICVTEVVRKFEIESGYCDCCDCRKHARHELQTSDATGAAGNQIGPVVLTAATQLKHEFGVSYDKIAKFLLTYMNIAIDPSTILKAEERLADKAKATFALILDALREANVVHADETGWRIGRLNSWLWVFSSPDVTIYAITYGHGHDVPLEMLGKDFTGVLVVDGLNIYDVLTYTKGRCNAHLLRRVKGLLETPSSAEAAECLSELRSIIKDALAHNDTREEQDDGWFTRRSNVLQERLTAWVEAGDALSSMDDEIRKLVKHVRLHLDEWLLFLRNPEVPPTNNHAEQMLRPSLAVRKTNGCNKTLPGAVRHAILMSLIATCHRKNRRFIDLARQLWASRDGHAVDIDSLPEQEKDGM